jgi:competence protein ComEA
MLGFTRNEQRVVLFLAGAFFAGALLKSAREHARPLTEAPESSGFNAAERREAAEIRTAAEPGGTGTASYPGVSLNRAGKADLESLPGIGPVMAGRILDDRRERGRFRSVDDLMRVRGVGPKTLEKIRPYLRID